MDEIANWIVEQIKEHGISAVFFGSMLEEAVAPIPSPAVMMGAGFILLGDYTGVSSTFIIELMKIALIAGIGALLGSYVIYGTAYFGGKPLVDKTKRFTGIKWSNIEKFQSRLENSKSDELTITALRSIPVMPAVVISATCGLLRINPLTYSISFYIGGVIRNIIFLIIGWRIGAAYETMAHGFDSMQSIFTVLIGVLLLGGLAYLYWRREKAEKVEDTQTQEVN